MKVLLIVGNITFHDFTKEELQLFKTDLDKKALVHEIYCIVECSSEEEADTLGEEALSFWYDSYVVPLIFEVGGEIVYECSSDILPIDVESFKSDFLG